MTKDDRIASYKYKKEWLQNTSRGTSSEEFYIRESSKVKMLESIRGEKEVQENLTFAYDSAETENKNKEVLECQLVTTS